MLEKEDHIISILESIDTNLERQQSLKRTLFQGVVRGFGTALGATIILAIVTSFTLGILNSINTTTVAESALNEAIE